MQTEPKAQLAELLNRIEVSVFVIDIEDGRILCCNQRVCDILDTSMDNVVGAHYTEIFPPGFCRTFEALWRDIGDGHTHSDVLYSDRRHLWEQLACQQIHCDSVSALLLNVIDITEIGRSLDAYERLANFDSLLGIPNGVKLEHDISALQDPHNVALVYVEIHYFDKINELYSFSVGDALLGQLRDWLIQSESRAAQLYRVKNGFALLGENFSEEDSFDRAAQILARFEEPWTVAYHGAAYTMYCHVDVGVVCGQYVKNEMRSLLMRTSRAPKNERGFSVYDEKYDEEVKRKLLLCQVLTNSLSKGMDGFAVHYQPIVERKTHRWIGAEALCRWTAPHGIQIPPLVFIHLAEEMGLIEQIDDWVRETAMRQCAGWGLGDKHFYLDVNFSPYQTIDDRFTSRLMATLRRTGFPTTHLNLEVTESAKLDFTEADMEGFRRLQRDGIQFSLDDFGTGYSTFENLIKIPGVYLKTEKLFLDDIETDSYRQYLMKVLVNIGHHLNMRIVAEGVETARQCALLEDLGVDCMQGYYFSPPLPAEQFEKELHRYT